MASQASQQRETFCSDSWFISTPTGPRDTEMMPSCSMASFLHLIVSMSTGPLRGTGSFWCLSALCCQVFLASTLTLPVNWQLAYRSESPEVHSRLLKYWVRRNKKRSSALPGLASIAEFFNHTEVWSYTLGQYHPILAFFIFFPPRTKASPSFTE